MRKVVKSGISTRQSHCRSPIRSKRGDSSSVNLQPHQLREAGRHLGGLISHLTQRAVLQDHRRDLQAMQPALQDKFEILQEPIKDQLAGIGLRIKQVVQRPNSRNQQSVLLRVHQARTVQQVQIDQTKYGWSMTSRERHSLQCAWCALKM